MTYTTSMESGLDVAQLEHGTVKAVTAGGLIVHSTGGVTAARAAIGCLVEPHPGDRVLVSRSGSECFVLSVLAREGSSRCIRVSGELTVAADRLSFTADEHVDVHGKRRINMRAGCLGVSADDTRVDSKQVSLCGERGEARFDEFRGLISSLELIGDRVLQCVRQVTRRVSEVEILNVGNLIQRVRENLLSRSRRASVTASGDMHIDGERIHMG